MTCIAWDGRTLAADRRACLGTMIYEVTKVHRLPDGSLFGGAGEFDSAQELLHWFREGAHPEEWPACQKDKDLWCGGILIRPEGTAWRIERQPRLLRIESPFFACGSGREMAMAVMHLGYTAQKAVEVASALDSACGNGMDTLTLVMP